MGITNEPIFNVKPIQNLILSLINTITENLLNALEVTQAVLYFQAEDRVKIIRLEALASVPTDNYSICFADYFIDSTGYYNTVDTANTSAVHDTDTDSYNCPSSGSPEGVIINDDFSDLDYNNWTIKAGTFTALSGNLKYNEAGADGRIHTACVKDLTAASTIWQFDCYTGRSSSFAICIGTGTNYDTDTSPCYECLVTTTGKVILRYHNGSGGTTALITGSDGNISINTKATIKITRNTSGDWEVFVNDTSIGTATNTSLTSITTLWTDFRAENMYTDNVLVCDSLSAGASDGVIQSVDLSTIANDGLDIDTIYIHVERSDSDGGSAILLEGSVDGGNTWVSNAEDGFIHFTTAGSHPMVKITLSADSDASVIGWSVFTIPILTE